MILRVSTLATVLLFAVGCTNDSPIDDEADCTAGSVGCACDADRSCDEGLSCYQGTCAVATPIVVDTETGTEPDTDSGNETDSDPVNETDSDSGTDPTCADDPCDANATCNDSGATLTCSCNNGWTGDGYLCTDINECALGSGGCPTGYECFNTPGGWSCNDIDECALGAGGCPTGYECANTPGSWSCDDIDECTDETDDCGAGYACANTTGSFTCTDIDECTAGSHNCHADATCTNSDGSFSCACNGGFTGDGLTCTDIDECTAGSHNCHADATCSNSGGSFSCACNGGFTGDGLTCTDIDECTDGTHNCHADATCSNSDGSFSCACNAGFAGDGITCNDIDECVLGTHDCATDPQCENTAGGWNCLAPLINWIDITGGAFTMGDTDQHWDLVIYNFGYHYVAYPIHTVTVPDFQMMETEVTVAQYRDCVTAGACTAPVTLKCDDMFLCDTFGPGGCGDLLTNNYYSSENRDLHPVNCVGASEAEQFCTWVGGRLPSESEWEYAAKNQGQDVLFPWGNTPPSCSHAVLHEEDNLSWFNPGLGWDEDPSNVSAPALKEGCDQLHTWPVGSKPAGNTVQGLKDMIGNVSEIMADCWHTSYDADHIDEMPNGNERPVDGNPWIDADGNCNHAIGLQNSYQRVIRGGGWHGSAARASLLQVTRYRTTSRHFMNEVWHTDPKSVEYTGTTYGFRCAK